MNKILASVIAALAVSGTALTASAQPAPKILVVEMAKILDTHYETEDQNAKLKVDEAKANEEIERIVKDGQAIEASMQEIQEKAKNPALSADAKAKLEEEFRPKAEERQRKLTELNNYRQRTQRVFQERIANFRGIMFEKINAIVAEVAKKKGATLVIDKSGLSNIGINALVYSDPAYDITEEVKKEIAKGRPANMPAPAAKSNMPAPAAKADAKTDTKAAAPLFTPPSTKK
ncbi:hypothetical protein IMCC26134_11070 [Verrucomicrobia bacterium IMCC26134]|jgi:outer membrane protein|nr:hypothetical protein IMCC26134_11070 [Verrucomicrobia bacterium IMCC26134]